LRDLQREDETGRRLERPIVDRLDRRATVERRIHLDGIEATRIVAKVVGGPHALGIEGAVPAVGGEG